MENVGKRSLSDLMETGCRDKRPSDSLRVSSRETKKIFSEAEYGERGGKCRQTDSVGSDGDGLTWQEAIRHRRVSFRGRIRNIRQGRGADGTWSSSGPYFRPTFLHTIHQLSTTACQFTSRPLC